MARENTVYLHGQIPSKPKLYVDPEGNIVHGTFTLNVMRRPFLTGEGQPNMGNLRIDNPVIMTRDPDLLKQVITFHAGDMVDVKGVLTTRNAKKDSFCPNGHRNSQIGTLVFVTPIYLCRREQGLSIEEGGRLIRDRCEISNNVIIVGTVCKELDFHEFDEEQKGCVAQYQIASNRRYHIKDAHNDERTDYPWVKTINQQARQDKEHLRVGSVVMLNAAIQTRNIKRELTCPICSAKYEIEETVSELFPYAVEYLMGCYFAPKEGEEEDQESEG